PRDSCWSSDSVWEELNPAVSSRLLKIATPVLVCYEDGPNHDPAAHESVISNWNSSMFHSSDPTNVHSTSADNSTCIPFTQMERAPPVTLKALFDFR
ncbi:hypothetical protein B0O99DRAFT_713317, partial [Bisporella sp. PMI_857]